MMMVTEVVMMVVMMVMTVMAAAVSPTHGQTTTQRGGLFKMHNSCREEGSHSSEPLNLKHLVVNHHQRWLRTLHPDSTLLHGDVGRYPTCPLAANSMFLVESVGSSVQVKLVGSMDESLCDFPGGTNFSLLGGGSVLVSCAGGIQEAEREIFASLPQHSNTHQSIHNPQMLSSVPTSGVREGRNFSLTSDQNGTQEARATEFPPATTEFENNEMTVNPLSSESYSEAEFITSEPVTSRSTEVAHISGRITYIATTASETSITRSPQMMISSDDTSSPPVTTTASTTTTIASTTTTPTTTTTTAIPTTATTTEADYPATTQLPRSQNIANAPIRINHVSSEANDQPDHLPYFIGAGVGVGVLIMGILLIVFLIKHRNRRNAKKPEDNNEDFFISGHYTNSLDRLRINSESGSGKYKSYKGIRNAHIMYSGAEPEHVESFELEERVLQSDSSTSEADVPKCLIK